MRTLSRNTLFTLSLLAALSVACPSARAQQQTTQPTVPSGRSPGGDVGSGAGDIGKGAGGAAGNVAKGTGKGAADIVTLHPVKGVGNVGKGVGVGAKDAGVGAAKGSGKIVKGTGRGIGHIFHHGHKDEPESTPPSN